MLKQNLYLPTALLTATLALTVWPSSVSNAQAIGSSVHVPQSGQGNTDLANYIKAALAKWKVPLLLSNNSNDADYVLLSGGEKRDRKWHEGVLTSRGATITATVELTDRCGNVAWIESAGDRSLLMDSLVGPFSKQGPRKVADRIAKRLKKALKAGKVLPPAKSCNAVAGDASGPAR